MTVDQVVVRRFDVEVEDPSLRAKVERALQSGRAEIKRIGVRGLEVRLEGSMAALSTVVRPVAGMEGVRIHHDRTRLPQHTEPKRRGGRTRALVGPTAVVAVVDSGIMGDHSDLKSLRWSGTIDGEYRDYGARCIGGTVGDDITDQNGHGTQLAGTILAAAAGALDVEPPVQLMTVKFFDADNLPGPDNGAAAIEFATMAEPKADIINLSWDLGIGSFALERAIKRACDAGALVVIAAGNSGSDNDKIPAIPAFYRKLCRKQIITVMATDRYNEKASFSNYGAKSVDLAAPGVDVFTTRASLSGASANALARDPFYRRYRPFNGTSAAAALVSGAAARLKASNPALTAEQLKVQLCQAARQVCSLKSKCVHGRFLDMSDLVLMMGALTREGRPA